MATPVRLSPAAENDFTEIYVYTGETFGTEQAEDYVAGLLDAMEQVSQFPDIGQSLDDLRSGYHRYIYRSHSLFYRSEGDAIVIIRILGLRQDHASHLG